MTKTQLVDKVMEAFTSKIEMSAGSNESIKEGFYWLQKETLEVLLSVFTGETNNSAEKEETLDSTEEAENTK